MQSLITSYMWMKEDILAFFMKLLSVKAIWHFEVMLFIKHIQRILFEILSIKNRRVLNKKTSVFKVFKNEILKIYTERQKSCTTFSFDFFWNKIDDFKNQFSLVFMPVQLTIVVEKIKRV